MTDTTNTEHNTWSTTNARATRWTAHCSCGWEGWTETNSSGAWGSANNHKTSKGARKESTWTTGKGTGWGS